MADENSVIGWTSVADTNAALALNYGGEAWSTASASEKITLLSTAYSEIRDNPNYDLPTEAGTQEWNDLSDDQRRRLSEAQQLHALYILITGGSDENSNLKAQGVKSFSIGKFSMSFDDAIGKNKAEFLNATSLSQKVKDKLYPFIVDVNIVGSFERRYI